MTAAVPLLITVILASAVEMVEAMTIILATGLTRGWRSTLVGTVLALVVLTAIVAIFGQALANVPINVLRLVVGFLLLCFGLQWLRKSILRATGYVGLHDEKAIYGRNVMALEQAPRTQTTGWDGPAFVVSFKGVFLEGLEVIMIVISFGVPAGHLGLAAAGAGAAALVVGIVGAALARPLAAVPENAMKMGVGLLLASFGAFWMGEGAGIEWPAADAFILVFLGLLGLVTFASIAYLKRGKEPKVQEAAA